MTMPELAFLDFKNYLSPTISDAEYDSVKNAWNNTLLDLLRWYSLLDVWLFFEAVLVYLELYRKQHLGNQFTRNFSALGRGIFVC